MLPQLACKQFVEVKVLNLLHYLHVYCGENLVEVMLSNFCQKLREKWGQIPKKGFPYSNTVKKILQEEGQKYGFQKEVRVKGPGKLTFDMVKRNVAIEVLWGNGDEFWKDLGKLMIDGDVNTLYIVGRYYPDEAMKGILYCYASLKSMYNFLKKNNLFVYLVRIFLPEDLDKEERREKDFDFKILK